MPRAQQSAEAKVLGFFKTAPLIVAGLVLRLASDVVKERADHAQKAGEGARKALAQRKRSKSATPATPAAPKAKATRKRAPRKKAAAAADVDINQ